MPMPPSGTTSASCFGSAAKPELLLDRLGRLAERGLLRVEQAADRGDPVEADAHLALGDRGVHLVDEPVARALRRERLHLVDEHVHRLAARVVVDHALDLPVVRVPELAAVDAVDRVVGDRGGVGAVGLVEREPAHAGVLVLALLGRGDHVVPGGGRRRRPSGPCARPSSTCRRGAGGRTSSRRDRAGRSRPAGTARRRPAGTGRRRPSSMFSFTKSVRSRMLPFVTASPMCCESRIGMSKSVFLAANWVKIASCQLGFGTVLTLTVTFGRSFVYSAFAKSSSACAGGHSNHRKLQLDRLGRELRHRAGRRLAARRSPRSHRLRRRLRMRRPPPPSPSPSWRQPPSDAIRSSLAASLSSSRRWEPFTLTA